MNRERASDALDQKLAAISLAAERFIGVNSYEHLLVELLDMLQSGQVGRDEAATALGRLAAQWSPGAPEILEFTMHALRWPEIRSALQDHQAHGTDFRTRDLAAQVLEAFEDDWPAGEIYDTYRQDD